MKTVLRIFIDDVRVYVGSPKSQKQVLNSFNSNEIQLYTDDTSYIFDYKECLKTAVRTVQFITRKQKELWNND